MKTFEQHESKITRLTTQLDLAVKAAGKDNITVTFGIGDTERFRYALPVNNAFKPEIILARTWRHPNENILSH
jgi:hypothetical protein